VSPSRRPPHFQALPVEVGLGLRLVGDLDLATVGDLERMLDTLPRSGERVTIDLAELSFMDSSGVHALVAYAGALNGSAPVALVNVPAHIHRLFVLTGADQNAAIDLREDERG
jgi:anti-anti-sigma factor